MKIKSNRVFNRARRPRQARRSRRNLAPFSRVRPREHGLRKGKRSRNHK
jgi:hypothetical protein